MASRARPSMSKNVPNLMVTHLCLAAVAQFGRHKPELQDAWLLWLMGVKIKVVIKPEHIKYSPLSKANHWLEC
jgi:hypothetical protein